MMVQNVIMSNQSHAVRNIALQHCHSCLMQLLWYSLQHTLLLTVHKPQHIMSITLCVQLSTDTHLYALLYVVVAILILYTLHDLAAELAHKRNESVNAGKLQSLYYQCVPCSSSDSELEVVNVSMQRSVCSTNNADQHSIWYECLPEACFTTQTKT